MNSFPKWLPPLIKLEDFNGDAIKYVEKIFLVFRADFIDDKPLFRKVCVVFDSTKEDDEKPRAFHHLTTEEDKVTRKREFNIRRSERLSWIKPIIENCSDETILIWEKEHFGKKRISNRIYLFLEKQSYIVFLEEKKNCFFLISAYPVNNSKKYLIEFNKYKTLKGNIQ